MTYRAASIPRTRSTSIVLFDDVAVPFTPLKHNTVSIIIVNFHEILGACLDVFPFIKL